MSSFRRPQGEGFQHARALVSCHARVGLGPAGSHQFITGLHILPALRYLKIFFSRAKPAFERRSGFPPFAFRRRVSTATYFMSDLDQRIATHSPTARPLLQRQREEQSTKRGRGTIPSREASGRPVPLSFAQESLWLVEQLAPGTVAYNEPVVLRIAGQLNTALLERSLQVLLARHESLRTSFQMCEGHPVQVIASTLHLPLEVVDFQDFREDEREPLARATLAASAAQPFDLGEAPLLRVKLLRLADDQHLLLLVLHHIITDGWSVEVLVGELTALYGAFSAGVPAPLPDLPLQYADYALWQRGHLQGELLEQLLTYWRGRIAGAPAVLELPTDHPRNSRQTFQGGQISFQVPPALEKALRALCQQEQTTVFMALLAAFQALLARYTGSSDLVVGSPIASRDRPETAGLIGYLANMLVLRTDLSGTPSFRELLGRVRTITLEAYLHQELPLEYLVEALQPERSLSYNPLFQVTFALEQAAPSHFETAGVTWQVETLPEVSAKFDLQLTIREGQEGLCGLFVYNRDLFEGLTIERMGGHWLTMLSAMVAHPDEPVATAPLLTQAERQRILVDWKGSEIPNAPVQCVPQLVEAQAAQAPQALAVADERTQLPYQALNQRANQLAHHLRTLGVGPNVLVGVCLERSVDLVVALLGVLKAGGAYVPLDPAYPASRLAFMVQDAQAPVLITRQQWASSFSPVGTQASAWTGRACACPAA